MNQSIGTYYPWQFAGSTKEKSLVKLYHPRSHQEIAISDEGGHILMLIPDGLTKIVDNETVIHTNRKMIAIAIKIQKKAIIKVEKNGALILHFDPAFITFSHPPELLNLYSRWQDIADQREVSLSPEDFRFCHHLISGFKHMEGMKSMHLDFYHVKNLDMLIVKIHECTLLVRPLSEEKQRAKALIFDFLGLVRLHYADSWTMDQYASSLLISKDYLHQLANRYVGKSPTEVIYDKQLIEAQILLKNTHLSVKEIASRLNFGDQNYFTRFFSKRVGLALSDFRVRVRRMQTTTE